MYSQGSSLNRAVLYNKKQSDALRFTSQVLRVYVAIHLTKLSKLNTITRIYFIALNTVVLNSKVVPMYQISKILPIDMEFCKY